MDEVAFNTEEEILNFKFDMKMSENMVAEYGRALTEYKKNSEVWTSDLTAELSFLKTFRKSKVFQNIMDYLQPKEEGQNVILDKDKLGEVFQYFLNKM